MGTGNAFLDERLPRVVFGRGDLSSVLDGAGSSDSLALLEELQDGLYILSCLQ